MDIRYTAPTHTAPTRAWSHTNMLVEPQFFFHDYFIAVHTILYTDVPVLRFHVAKKEVTHHPDDVLVYIVRVRYLVDHREEYTIYQHLLKQNEQNKVNPHNHNKHWLCDT